MSSASSLEDSCLAVERPQTKRLKTDIKVETEVYDPSAAGRDYSVKGILECRSSKFSSDGRDYLVEWSGEEAELGWEPLQLICCKKLLCTFWKHHLNLKKATLMTLTVGMVVLAPWIENDTLSYWHAEVLSVGHQCNVIFLWDENKHQYYFFKDDPLEPTESRVRCTVSIHKLWIDHHVSLPCLIGDTQEVCRPQQRCWSCHSCGKYNEMTATNACVFCTSSRMHREVGDLENAVQLAYAALPQDFRVLAVISEPSMYRDALLAQFMRAPLAKDWKPDHGILSQLSLKFPLIDLPKIQSILRWCGLSAKLLLLPFDVMSTGQQYRVSLAYILLSCYGTRKRSRLTVALSDFCTSVDLYTARSLAVAIARLRLSKDFNHLSLVVNVVDGGLVKYLGCEGTLQLRVEERLEQAHNDNGPKYSFHYVSNLAAEVGNSKNETWFLPDVQAHLYYHNNKKAERDVGQEEKPMMAEIKKRREAKEIPEFGLGRLPTEKGIEVQVKLDSATEYVQKHYPLCVSPWDGWLHYSLPNFENFHLPPKWSLGALLGPSGCGKSVLLAQLMRNRVSPSLPLWPPLSFTLTAAHERPDDRPLLDYFVNHELYLKAMQVPCEKWTWPWSRLSVSESVCVCYARAIAETGSGGILALDEFTSGLPRELAKCVAQGLRSLVDILNIRVVVASCHEDIRLHLDSDWMLDPSTSSLDLRQPTAGVRVEVQTPSGWLQHDELFNDAKIVVELRPCDPAMFQLFKQNHYLKKDLCIAGGVESYLGTVDSQIAVFVAARRNARKTSWWHTSRLVVLPNFQGLGLGPRAEEALAHLMTTIRKVQSYSSITSHEYAHDRTQSGLWKLVSRSKSAKTDVPSLSHKWLRCICQTNFHTRVCGFRKQLQELRFKITALSDS